MAYPRWVQDVLPKFCHTALLDTREELIKHAQELNLPRFCQDFATLNQLQWLVKQAQTYPTLAQTIIEHHGSLDFLHRAIKNAALRQKQANLNSVLDDDKTVLNYRFPPLHGSVLDEVVPHPIKTGALTIIEYNATWQTDLPGGVDEDDQEELLRNGLLIKNRRTGEQVSVPYNVQTEQCLTNPPESDLYMVLIKPATLERCYVAHNPHGADRRANFATIVRLDGQRNWVHCYPWHAPGRASNNRHLDVSGSHPTIIPVVPH